MSEHPAMDGPNRADVPTVPAHDTSDPPHADDPAGAASALPRPAVAARRATSQLPGGSEWTFDLVERYDREIARIAADYGLDTYPNQIEVIGAEQMMDA